MCLSTTKNGFRESSSLTFQSKATNKKINIPSQTIIDAVVNTNDYLMKLKPMFKEMGFDIFNGLGQRNLSGFVGEIFVRSFSKKNSNFLFNAHPDGRPDLIDLSSKKSEKHYNSNCFNTLADGTVNPIRSKFAPYVYGGLEVKSSIGTPISQYKKRLKENLGVPGFEIGMSRIDYLHSITYWGHHTSCENLIGLYYDYYNEADFAPQILAVMHSEIDPSTDWRKVSTGKKESKKTSNTSLTLQGQDKLYNNVITVINDQIYLDKLSSIGLNI